MGMKLLRGNPIARYGCYIFMSKYFCLVDGSRMQVNGILIKHCDNHYLSQTRFFYLVETRVQCFGSF